MKKRVAVVGATGIAGQQFLVALAQHPWFDVVLLAASERSAGKTYGAAIRDARTGARRWSCPEEPPTRLLDLPVENSDGLNVVGVDIVFSAVESDAARVLEPQYAKTAAVLSTASAFRYEADVPIMVPGVNLPHAAQIEHQRERRGWRGFIVPLPNCTTMGLAITLKPLLDRFGVKAVVMTSMQGVSGAGAVAGGGGARHPRQHHSLRARGGGEGCPRDGEDSRRPDRGRHRAGGIPGQRDLHTGRRQRRTHRGGVGVIGLAGHAGRGCRGLPRVRRRATGARLTLCAAAAHHRA